jgi:uracil phosphoribosyltransferase
VLPLSVTTPVGRPYAGVKFEGQICGVSIMRAGEAMEQALRECCRSVRIGKILIQRDEETSKPRLFYDKLPADIKDRWVLLLDPMLATGTSNHPTVPLDTGEKYLICFTGGSAMMAVEVLLSKGVPEERILFLNLIASPEGAQNFAQRFPRLRIVTAFVDEGLDEKKYVHSQICLRRIHMANHAPLQLHRSRSRRFWRSLLHSVVFFLDRRLCANHTILVASNICIIEVTSHHYIHTVMHCNFLKWSQL